jgi:hypothetical protein
MAFRGDPPTLCFPDSQKTCFACCPPIRPAGYEHISYKTMVQRTLRENTASFAERGKGIFPITGFSCWALGYLDKGYQQVGCLLHPGRNEGVDLRYRVDYGDKCQRESCPEAQVFLGLGVEGRKFWLHLARGLDAFSYSSKKANPLFRMMGWGADLLGRVASREAGRGLTKERFFKDYPFFDTRLNPRANAYLINQLVKRNGVDPLKTIAFRERFEAISAWLEKDLLRRVRERAGSAYTHLLGLDASFLDFLRLSVGLQRVDPESALDIKDRVDQALLRFQPPNS